MSIEMMNRVWWREDLKGATKAVALALADAADDGGVCYPSVRTLQLKAGWSRKTVQTALLTLQSMNLLRVLHRHDRSSVYQFVIDNMPIQERKPGHKEASLIDHLEQGGLVTPGADATPPGCESDATPAHLSRPPGVAPTPRTQIGTQSEPESDSGNLSLPGLSGDNVPSIQEDQFVAEKWNEAAEKHPGIRKCRLPLDHGRARAILARSKQTSDDLPTSKELWEYFFARIEASEFLQGRAQPTGGRTEPFKLSLTWALKPANFAKIMEGAYESSRDAGPTNRPDGSRMGPAEQSTARVLSRRRAAQSGRRGGGDSQGAHAGDRRTH